MNLKYLWILFILIGTQANAQILSKNGVDCCNAVAGEEYTIYWENQPYQDSIQVYNDSLDLYMWSFNTNTSILIATNLDANTSSIKWRIPDSLANNSLHRLYLANSKNHASKLFSDCYLDIKPPAVINDAEEGAKINPVQYVINISPQPAYDNLNISSDHVISSINLYDLKGANILEMNNINSSSYILNTRSINSGVYIVKCTFEDNTIVTKQILINK